MEDQTPNEILSERFKRSVKKALKRVKFNGLMWVLFIFALMLTTQKTLLTIFTALMLLFFLITVFYCLKSLYLLIRFKRQTRQL